MRFNTAKYGISSHCNTIESFTKFLNHASVEDASVATTYNIDDWNDYTEYMKLNPSYPGKGGGSSGAVSELITIFRII